MTTLEGTGSGATIRIGLIGLGAMGRNHLRVLGEIPGVRLAAIGDPLPAALEAAGAATGAAMYAEDDGDRGWAGQVNGRKVRYAVCTENGAEMLTCEGLIAGAVQDGL